MEEIFLRIRRADEAEAAIGDDLLDCSGGHSDLQHLLEHRSNARSVREGVDHTAPPRRSRRGTHHNIRTDVRPAYGRCGAGQRCKTISASAGSMRYPRASPSQVTRSRRATRRMTLFGPATIPAKAVFDFLS